MGRFVGKFWCVIYPCYGVLLCFDALPSANLSWGLLLWGRRCVIVKSGLGLKSDNGFRLQNRVSDDEFKVE